VRRSWSKLAKPNNLFLMNGKPIVPPYWFLRLTGFCAVAGEKALLAFSALLLWK
jgi:hypothetical protein